MIPKNRPPTPPGEMLLEEYLKPRGLTQVDLAARMGVPVQRVNTIVNGRRGITAETAILLSEALNTSPEIWMGLQSDHDLWHALKRRAAALASPPRPKGHGKRPQAA
jgi:antitoxin HigA-1